MRLKSYFSGTVEGAMMLARQEMGDEAMLIHAKPASPEMRYLGAYEVVFGLEDPAPLPEPEAKLPVSKAPEAAKAPAAEVAGPGKPSGRAEGPQAPTRDWLAQQMETLKQEMLRMSQSLHEAENAPREEPIETGFSVEANVGRHGVKRAMAVLIGPAGAGKTTTLAKLAARCGLAARKSTHILSVDNLRIGAAEQLRTIAALLNVGFDLAPDVARLDKLTRQHAETDLVLIDTPGLSPVEMDEVGELAQWIAKHPEMDTHLVLPATMHLEDMERSVEQYRIFAPKKLLFTHLDEVGDLRRILSLSAHTGIPISFFAQGQRIPDDIEFSTKERLMELASGQYLRKGAAA